MSAYLLDANEIAVVAKICRNYVAADSDVWNHVAKKIVDRNEFEMVLALENIASLEARYPNNGIAGGFICGGQAGLLQYYNEVGKKCEQRADVKIPKNLDDRVAELNRYEYQACEREDFYSSDAYWVIARAKEAILREYVKMQNNAQVAVAA